MALTQLMVMGALAGKARPPSWAGQLVLRRLLTSGSSSRSISSRAAGMALKSARSRACSAGLAARNFNTMAAEAATVDSSPTVQFLIRETSSSSLILRGGFSGTRSSISSAVMSLWGLCRRSSSIS